VRKIHRSIKIRLTFVTVAFSLFVTVTLVVFSLVQLQQVVRTNLLQSVEFNLHLVAELMQRDIEYLDRLRVSAINQPQTARFLLDEYENARHIRDLHTRLSEEMMQNPVVYRDLRLRRLVVTDSELSRRVQVGFFTDRIPLMPQTLHLLGNFSESAPTGWTGIKIDPLATHTAEPVLYTISPVLHGANGGIIGYVYLAVSTNVISQPLSGYRFLDEGNLYLRVGDVNYQILDGQFIEVALDFADVREGDDVALNAATEIFSFQGNQGGRYLAVLSPLGQTGIYLTQTFPTGLVLQETYLVVRLFLLICLGVFILGVLIALYLSRIINRPVRQIGRQVQAIAGGDFSPNPHIEWDDEFGEIGRGINQLARDVDALIKSRLESEKRKRDLEYKMLQSQINPHFLYNSLNSIKWMATIQNATGIAEITVSLSRLLKSVAKIDRAVVPLAQELALLEDYFVISRYRYGGSITSKVDVPHGLMDCVIPIFTLQPIVENAIFHGIEANGGIGTVTVSACVTDDNALEITVEDNGIGMDDDTIRSVFETDSGDNRSLFQKVGIYNVHTRIQYEFGASYGLRIQSRPGEFTRVIVRLPYQEGGAAHVKAVDG
jgi:two-component system sensor histidine kinase YesM